MIYHDEDKSNDYLHSHMMGRFRRFLNTASSRSYTWLNECGAPTLVKLDKVFYTIDWEDLLPNCWL